MDGELVSQESDALSSIDLISTKGARTWPRSVCKAPVDGEKGQSERGCARIDDEPYSIVGDAVCAIGADSAVGRGSRQRRSTGWKTREDVNLGDRVGHGQFDQRQNL